VVPIKRRLGRFLLGRGVSAITSILEVTTMTRTVPVHPLHDHATPVQRPDDRPTDPAPRPDLDHLARRLKDIQAYMDDVMRYLSLLMLFARDATSEEPSLGLESSRREIDDAGAEILIAAGSAHRELGEMREALKP